MAGVDTKARPPMTERKIGHTTYTVTSHFAENGATATDRIKRLIDMDSRTENVKKVL